MLTKMPDPPYYAVIFTSVRNDVDHEGYQAMNKQLMELGKAQTGFLGMDAVREAGGLGIAISYWATLEDVRSWKENAKHKVAQDMGKNFWYQTYNVRVCEVQHEYGP